MKVTVYYRTGGKMIRNVILSSSSPLNVFLSSPVSGKSRSKCMNHHLDADRPRLPPRPTDGGDCTESNYECET